MADLIRYNPYNERNRMLWEMDRFFDDFMAVPPSTSLVDRLAAQPFWSVPWNRTFQDNLAVDMVETDDAITVKTALPGVRPEDVEIEERDGWLSIRAQSRIEQDREQAGWHVRERRYGAWQRTLRLPAAVNVDRADAQLHNGVLTITLPKGKES